MQLILVSCCTSSAGLRNPRVAIARPAPCSRRVIAAAAKGPVVVVDNYDSFTYNLCQVRRGR